VYIICRDFDRSTWQERFSTAEFTWQFIAYDSSFVQQLLCSCRQFQLSQIHTIESNIRAYNRSEQSNRRFRKYQHRMKQDTLDRYLQRCQLRPLMSDERHLLNNDLPLNYIHSYRHARPRFGTFNEQHRISLEYIRNIIDNGSFCLICSKMSSNVEHRRCATCEQFTKIIDTNSLTSTHIFIGSIVARERTIIDCVYGLSTNTIENSCFSNRFLLKMTRDRTATVCQEKYDIYIYIYVVRYVRLFSKIEHNHVLPSFDDSLPSIELVGETFELLRQIANKCHINVRD
jgi:hypothetical protein